MVRLGLWVMALVIWAGPSFAQGTESVEEADSAAEDKKGLGGSTTADPKEPVKDKPVNDKASVDEEDPDAKWTVDQLIDKAKGLWRKDGTAAIQWLNRAIRKIQSGTRKGLVGFLKFLPKDWNGEKIKTNSANMAMGTEGGAYQHTTASRTFWRMVDGQRVAVRVQIMISSQMAKVHDTAYSHYTKPEMVGMMKRAGLELFKKGPWKGYGSARPNRAASLSAYFMNTVVQITCRARENAKAYVEVLRDAFDWVGFGKFVESRGTPQK